MAQLPSHPPAILPIWTGRRGVVNTVVCCALAVLCAWALWWVTERSVIVPACTTHATAGSMAYSDFKLVGVRHASTVVCLLKRPDGRPQDVYLNELVSGFTDLWVGLAMTLEITVPAFVILLGLLRSWWYLGARARQLGRLA